MGSGVDHVVETKLLGLVKPRERFTNLIGKKHSIMFSHSLNELNKWCLYEEEITPQCHMTETPPFSSTPIWHINEPYIHIFPRCLWFCDTAHTFANPEIVPFFSFVHMYLQCNFINLHHCFRIHNLWVGQHHICHSHGHNPCIVIPLEACLNHS